MYYFFIHSSADGHLGSFHILAIVNSTAMNTEVHVSFLNYSFLWISGIRFFKIVPGKIPWRRDRLLTPVFLSFPCGSAHKESACNVGDLGLIPGLVKSPKEGKINPLQYSGLENSIDCIDHGDAKS